MTPATAWRLLSYVPWTAQWSAYRDTVRYVHDAEEVAATLIPGFERFPRPIPRHPEACVLAVQSMSALVRACRAGIEGGDAAAVFSEHMPTFP